MFYIRVQFVLLLVTYDKTNLVIIYRPRLHIKTIRQSIIYAKARVKLALQSSHSDYAYISYC